MPIDAIIFDLDGTLVDTNHLHTAAWADAFERHGYRIAEDRIFAEIGKGGDHLVGALIGEKADERHGDALRKAEPEIFSELAVRQRVRPMEGGVELLAECRRRGLRTALATSSERAQLDVISRSSGVDWSAAFDVIATADDADRSKPSPDIVSAAVAKMGLSPAQCALIGDTPYDVIAARDAGLVSLGVECGGHSSAALRKVGARRGWKTPLALLRDLDEALRLCHPGTLRLTADVLEQLMRAALEAASAGLAAGEAPIGCVIADGGGRILASGFNSLNAAGDRTAHAEMVAFRRAAGHYNPDADDLLLVSTLEPCVMCLGAAMESAVDTAIYGLPAPADGGTSRVLPPTSAEAKMPRVVGQILSEPCRDLFRQFLRKPSANPKQLQFAKQLLDLTPG